jgi:hypothetical protein
MRARISPHLHGCLQGYLSDACKPKHAAYSRLRTKKQTYLPSSLSIRSACIRTHRYAHVKMHKDRLRRVNLHPCKSCISFAEPNLCRPRQPTLGVLPAQTKRTCPHSDTRNTRTHTPSPSVRMRELASSCPALAAVPAHQFRLVTRTSTCTALSFDLRERGACQC